MKERDLHILENRRQNSSESTPGKTGAEETFQHQTLQPVIELQNDLLVESFKNYVKKHKNVFHDLNIEKRLKYIENAIQKDTKFRNSLKGMILGQFTLEEYRVYTENSSALNKRMMNLVKERIQSNIQLFDPLSTLGS